MKPNHGAGDLLGQRHKPVPPPDVQEFVTRDTALRRRVQFKE